MKLRTVAVVGALVGVGAYLASRWNKVSQDDQEKKLITLQDPIEKHPGRHSKELTTYHVRYPELQEDFVEAVYSQKKLLDEEYPLATNVRVYHQVLFMDSDKLQDFVTKMTDAGYDVDFKEDSLIVKLAKNCQVEHNTILDDIYNVADVAAKDAGSYQGYSVEVL